MNEEREPTDQELWLIELQDDLEAIEESLHFCHREAEHDRWIRLNERKDALIKRIDHAKEMQQ